MTITQPTKMPLSMLWLDRPQAQEAAAAGGKAAPLARLAAMGVRVPPGFVVPAAAYQAAVGPLREQIDTLLAGSPEGEALGAAAAAIQALVLAAPPDEALAAVIACEALTLLQQPVGDAQGPRLLAVRSSATVEDLPGASFAGQYDTYLGVETAVAVAEAVRRCWASYWSARAISYRAQHAVDHWPGAMAVLVQRLVPAASAGVAFTAHPTMGHRYLLTVNAALGLGQGVVDGSAPADTYAVDKDLRQVVHRHVLPKTHRVVPAGGTTERVEVETDRAQAPALTDEQLLQLLDLACEIERQMGAPQDIEWAFTGAGADGRSELFVLQSRPITALPLDPAAQFPIAWDDPKDRALHWKLSTARGDEQKGRPYRPLDVDAMELEGRAWTNAAYLTGRENLAVITPVGVYRYWAEKPAFPSDEVRRVVQQEFEARVERYREAGTCMYPEEQRAELEATNARLWAFDREAAPDTDLADHLEEVGRVFVRHWTLHWYWWQGDWTASSKERKHEGRWEQRYQELTGDRRKGAAARLLEGLPTKLSEAVDRIMALARIAQRRPALRQALEQRDPAAFLAAIKTGELPGAGPFRRELEALLEEQGLRSGQGAGADTNPLTPGWAAEPRLVLDIVRQYLPRDLGRLRRLRRAAARRRERRLAVARRRVGDEAAKLERFDRAYAAACASARWFEDHNYFIDSATQSLRYLALTAAVRRLIAGGALEKLDDVWWLRLGEIAEALRSQETPELQPLVAERQAEHARWEALTPPPWLGAPPPPPKTKSEAEQTEYTAAKAERAKREGADAERVRVRGQSGSRGVATGRVRIVPTETPVPRLEPGDILVARNAGPLWTPVFPAVGAIVLEGGAFFQHAMLTAREYRVPAVFQAKDATKTLQEGDLVTVDGARGLVLRVEPPGGGESDGETGERIL